MLDDATIELECPNGHKVKVKLGKARKSPTIRCTRCSGTINIDGSELDREARKVDREMDKLKRDLERL